MALYRDEGVVLRVQKLGEADRIVTVLTRTHGRVRAVAKGVRRTRSRFGASVEPFSAPQYCVLQASVELSRLPPASLLYGHLWTRALRSALGQLPA